MAKKKSPVLLITLIAIGASSIAGVYFYIQSEQRQLDEFNARQEEKFANHKAAGPGLDSDTNAAAQLLGKSPVTLQLSALRAKISRDRAASPLGQPLNTEGMSPDEIQKIKELRRTLGRSFAGRYSRAQVHSIVPAIKEMLRDPSNPAVATINNASTTAKLSWRVHLLPYIGERALYERFHLEEPWDSEHNKALLSKMPMLFRGLYDKEDATVTRLLAVDTVDSFGRGGRLRAVSELTDPESDTLALVIVGTKLAVPWTKPMDFTATPEQFTDRMKLMPKPTFWVGTLEGAALNVRFDGSYKTFAAMATMTGGEPNAFDEMQKEKARLMRAHR